ncbi:MAG: SH3 domain-containing protein [Defluviicoccus sp.]
MIRRARTLLLLGLLAVAGLCTSVGLGRWTGDSSGAPGQGSALADEARPPAKPVADDRPAQVQGLPVPRFVTLRAAEANMRTGPDTKFPIKWVYQRPGLPLEVIAEHHHWRRVRDIQGNDGWMHKRMLSGRRAVMLTGPSVLYDSPASNARPLVRLDPLVVLTVLKCPPALAWCQVTVEDYRGWTERSRMWGVYPNEVIE